jgi:hypothetical protein
MKESMHQYLNLGVNHHLLYPEVFSNEAYHAHLGNCVKRDPANLFYGDQHPALGVEGGENNVPELIEFLQAALDSGFLNRETPPSVSIEMRPMLDQTPEELLSEVLEKLSAAWEWVRPHNLKRSADEKYETNVKS